MDLSHLSSEERAIVEQALAIVNGENSDTPVEPEFSEPEPIPFVAPTPELPQTGKIIRATESSHEPSSAEQLSTGTDVYQEFLDKWTDPANANRRGVNVLGRKVRKSIADELMRKAIDSLSDQFSIYQLLLIMARQDLTLNSYFKTLVNIRDNTENAARDRMAANREIHQTLLTFLKAHTTPETRPAYATQQQSDKDKNILGVLVNVNAPLPNNPTAQTEVKQLTGNVINVEDTLYDTGSTDGESES